MSLASGIHGLWLASLLLKGLLVAVVISKRAWEKFPWFSGYCIFGMLETTVLYSLSHQPQRYLYVYLVGESVSIALGLAIVYEVFNHLLFMQSALRRVATLVFRTAIVLLLLLAAAVIYVGLPFHVSDVRAALFTVEEAARVLEVGLLLFLFIFSSAFGLQWRQPVFGIALGLGILAAVKLTVVTVLQYANSSGGMINLALAFTIDLSLLIWVGYLLAPERITTAAEIPDRTQLEQWNQAIMELIHQ